MICHHPYVSPGGRRSKTTRSWAYIVSVAYSFPIDRCNQIFSRLQERGEKMVLFTLSVLLFGALASLDYARASGNSHCKSKRCSIGQKYIPPEPHMEFSNLCPLPSLFSRSWIWISALEGKQKPAFQMARTLPKRQGAIAHQYQNKRSCQTDENEQSRYNFGKKI